MDPLGAKDPSGLRSEARSLPGRRFGDVFVGRTAELEALRVRIDAAVAGRGGLALVAGEPGIGKTRIAEEAAQYAWAKTARVLWGECWEGEGAPVFWPWVQVLRSVAASVDREVWTMALGDYAADIAEAMPDLEADISAAAVRGDRSDTHQNRFRFLDGFASFLKRLGAVDPLVIVLDDLHWADQDSLLLLQFVTGMVATSPILLIGTYRDLDLRPNIVGVKVLATIARNQNTTTISLPGLNESEVRSLLLSIDNLYPSERSVKSLTDRTDGNPFFLRELVSLRTRAGYRTWTNEGTSEPPVPLTLRETIHGHLRTLSPQCTSILGVASAIGREFAATLVFSVLQEPALELGRLLDEATSSGIIELIGVMRYRFRHALVREVTYERLPTLTRARIHEDIVQAMERMGYANSGSNLSLLAHHACMSVPVGATNRALEYSIRASVEARRRLAYEEAVLHCERALEVGGPTITPERLCELLLLLGDAQALSGRWTESRRSFERAAVEARLSGSPAQFARAAIGFNGIVGNTNPVDEAAVSLLRDALSRLGVEDSALHVRVLRAITHALYFADAEAEMDRYSVQAVEIAERLTDGELVRIGLDARLIRLMRPAYLDEMFGVATQLLDMSVKASDKEMAFRGRLARHVCLLQRGDLAAASRELDRAAYLAGEIRHPRCTWQIQFARSSRALTLGDFAESLILTESARETGERVHDGATAHYFLLQRFQGDRLRGRLQGWEHIGNAVLAQWPTLVTCRLAQILVLAKIGAKHEARRMLATSAKAKFRDIGCDTFFLWNIGILAETCAHCGELEWCNQLYEIMSPYRDHCVVAAWGVVFDGSVSHFLGILSAALGRFDDAAAEFQVALDINLRMRATPIVTRTQIHFAELLLTRGRGGDIDRAVELLSRVIESNKQGEQIGYLARCRELLSETNCGTGRRTVELLHGRDATRKDMNTTNPVQDLTDGYRFRREAEFWTIIFGGTVSRLRRSRGLAILEVLLRKPNTLVHVLDIISVLNGASGCVSALGSELPDQPTHIARDMGPAIDTRARDEYRRRVDELRDELADAERWNDVGRASALRIELEQVADALRRAYGYRGRPRRPGSSVERARINVRNNITNALILLKQRDVALWRHLDSSVRTGTFCIYRPERPIPWEF